MGQDILVPDETLKKQNSQAEARRTERLHPSLRTLEELSPEERGTIGIGLLEKVYEALCRDFAAKKENNQEEVRTSDENLGKTLKVSAMGQLEEHLFE